MSDLKCFYCNSIVGDYHKKNCNYDGKVEVEGFTFKQLQQSRREGWEQSKREAFEVARTLIVPYSVQRCGTIGIFVADAIAAMEYGESK